MLLSYVLARLGCDYRMIHERFQVHALHTRVVVLNGLLLPDRRARMWHIHPDYALFFVVALALQAKKQALVFDALNQVADIFVADFVVFSLSSLTMSSESSLLTSNANSTSSLSATLDKSFFLSSCRLLWDRIQPGSFRRCSPVTPCPCSPFWVFWARGCCFSWTKSGWLVCERLVVEHALTFK